MYLKQNLHLEINVKKKKGGRRKRNTKQF